MHRANINPKDKITLGAGTELKSQKEAVLFTREMTHEEQRWLGSPEMTKTATILFVGAWK